MLLLKHSMLNILINRHTQNYSHSFCMNNSRKYTEELISLLQQNKGIIYSAIAFYYNTCSPYEREELISEFLLRVCNAYPIIPHKKNIHGWLYAIAKNTAIDCMNKNNKHKSIYVPLNTDLDFSSYEFNFHHYAAECEEKKIKFLQNSQNILSNKEYEIFSQWINNMQNPHKRRYYNETAYKRIYRIRKKLRHIYEQKIDE